MTKKYPKPHQKWGVCIELMLDGKLNQKQIAKEIGMTEQTLINWKKNPQFQDMKFRMERERLKSYVPDALKTMVELLQTAESENVRFYAARDILDRAGHKAVDVSEVTSKSEVNIKNNPLQDLSTEDIKKLIDKDED